MTGRESLVPFGPSYCYDAAKPPEMTATEQAKRSAARIDRLIREHEANRG